MTTTNLVVGNDGGQSLQGTAAADLIYGFDPNSASEQASSIQALRVATGFDQPLFATAVPGDQNRLFVVEKTGHIEIVDLSQQDTGVFSVKATPFLDVSNQISTDSESGLLGLAFDPDYAHNGFFYVNLVNKSGDTEIRRYHVSSNPDVADPASASLVITIDQPAGLGNHKAGWLAFGPDGDLYAALGDGGGGGDPSGNGQNINSLLGKMLRLDVHGDDFPNDPTRNYAIPADNPFVGKPGADEIFAYGLRNPWRDTFDRATGQFIIADVGQGKWEEIDLGQKGANYGWNSVEGPEVFTPGASTAGLTPPIYFYDHSVGISIVGGYVYRGPAEQLQGQYFFSDFGTGFIDTLQFINGQWVENTRTAQVVTSAGHIDSPSSFGEDARGNLYLTDIADGELYRLTPTGTSHDGADIIAAGAGDDMVFAGAGNDAVSGGAGNDTLNGMDGDDTLVGNDDIFASEPDTLNGGNGNDTILGEVSDTINGGAGIDTLQAVNSNPWTIDLGVTSIETMQAGFGDDHIDAATQTTGVTVFAGGGNDSVMGSPFDDFLWGGAGNDTLTGGGGNDLLFGDVGADNLSGDAGDDTIYADGADNIDGGDGHDVLYWTDSSVPPPSNLAALSIEWVQTQSGDVMLDFTGGSNDVIAFAGSGNNTVTGGAGNDFLWGEDGNDTLVGNAGNDTLVGGPGADRLTGGAGTDNIYGNIGGGGDSVADTYLFDTPDWGTDFVYDFDNGTDTFDMHGSGAGDFAALTVTTSGPHAQIAFGGNLIVVVNAAGQIDASDFVF